MRISPVVFCVGILVCTSCNIKQPLKNILTEANMKPVACLTLYSKVDTFFLNPFFPALNAVDSVTGDGISFQSLKKDQNSFRLEVRDLSVKFHKISIYKGGNSVTMMVLYNDTTNSLVEDKTFIVSIGMLNQRLLFKYKKQPVEFYALWQNVVLPSRFITFGKNNVSVRIPKETRQVKESYIRIFGTDGNKMVLDLRVPLIYGIPLPNPVK